MSGRHLTSFALDLAALSGKPDAAAEAHLAGCERCRKLATELSSHREQFQREVGPRTLPRLQASTSGWARLRLGRFFTFALPAAALASLALVWGLNRPSDYAVKGGPALQLFGKRGAEVFAVREGGELHPGDQLRFAVEAGGYGYLMIASLDGAGHPNVYYPFDGDQSATITTGARSELPGSITLDGTLGSERLYALFSTQPFASSLLLGMVEHDRPPSQIDVPPGYLLVTFGFKTVAP